MSHFLVTGGAGFIGSHLVDSLLAQGHRVRVLDDLSTGKMANLAEGAELVEGDILDNKLLARCLSDVDGCFHLAAVSTVHGTTATMERARRVNRSGASDVFDAVANIQDAARPLPVVYASSAAVYGDANEIPTTESAKTEPISDYGADKAYLEKHAAQMWSQAAVPSLGLRLFNVYGPRQDPESLYTGVVNIFLDRLIAGEGVDIFGDGAQVRDFVYVDDAVNHFLAAMDWLESGATVLNVCSGRGITIDALFSVLCELTGAESEVCYRPARDGDINISIGDPRSALALIGVRAQTDLRQGLEALIRYKKGVSGPEVDASVRAGD